MELAQSRLYPSLVLVAELKRHGDSLELDGDGYTNADRSYAGVVARWNLFNAFSDTKQIEAAKLKELASATQLEDYEAKIKEEIESAFLEYAALNSKLKSAKMEIKAKEAYYKLILGRFDNQLATADELSRCIADLAAAKAKEAVMQSRRFMQHQKILLLSDTNAFLRQNGIEH